MTDFNQQVVTLPYKHLETVFRHVRGLQQSLQQLETLHRVTTKAYAQARALQLIEGELEAILFQAQQTLLDKSE